MDYLILILGFTLLIFSGNYLVKSAANIANHFNISKMVIGLLVVSFGTSAPELFVSLQAAFKGLPEMALGNVIGSNIANIALVLGLTSIIFPIIVKSKTIFWDWSLMLIASIMLYLFILDNLLSSYEGVIFLVVLASYILFTIKHNKISEDKVSNVKSNLWIDFLLLIGSMFGMYFGSDFLVESASSIAKNWGVSEKVISVTIIAFGTSVPELATSVIAAFKKEMDISIGNIIGSNIFNILSILGITVLVHPIHVNAVSLNTDMYWMIGIAVALLLSILPLKKGQIGRVNGLLFVAAYFIYIFSQFS